MSLSKGDSVGWAEAPKHVADVTVYDSLPKLLAHNAKNWPNDVAQREKEFGIWNAFSWADVQKNVSQMAVGFAELGVGPGEVVAIIGDNRPEWVWSEIAAHACRAFSLGVYRDALEQEILHLINLAQPRIVVAEDEEQVDKFLELGDQIPCVRHIVYHDPRGMRKYDDPRLMSIDELRSLGAAALGVDSSRYDKMVEATSGEDESILCTTSGTTSNPKLAVWRNRALLGHAHSYLRTDPRGPDDEYLAALPLPWVMEQMYSVAWNLVCRMRVNFAEEQDTTMADMREIGPTFVLLSPRVWELIAADSRARMMDASWWKRAIYDWGVASGARAVDKRQKPTAAELLLFRALRDRLGFSRLRSAATGGAAMGPDTFKFFQAMGVPLKQLYGQTEAMGAYVIHADGDVDYETVGFPMPGCDVLIRDPDADGLGEILVRHDNVMSSYYRQPEETAECFTDEGWFATGDAGYLNDGGHLVVIDRIKDIAETSTGVRFSPQYIENKLKFSPYIAEAVILGKDREYLASMVCIRYSVVSKWAEERRISFTTYSDLASRPEIYALIRGEIERVNQSLPEKSRIEKFLLLYKELDADDGELTRTKKVRRSVIADKYGDIIDAIYAGADHLDVDTVIHFQDGSSQRVVTTLAIESLVDVKLEAAE